MPSQNRSQSRQPSGVMRSLPRTRVCLVLVCCCVAIILWLTLEQGRTPSNENPEARWFHAKIIPDVETNAQHHHSGGVQHHSGGVLVMQDGEEEGKGKHYPGHGAGGGDGRGKKTGDSKPNKSKKKNKEKAKYEEVELNDLGMKEEEAERWIKENIKTGYCNPPDREITGEEGKFKPGFNLKAAYVVARHGDRTPMQEFADIPNSNWHPQWNCDLKQASKTITSDTLKRFVDQMQAEIIRGDMTGALGTFKNLPVNHNGICKKSQLTPIGWLQHLELGTFFRKAYGRTLVQNQELLRDVSNFQSTMNLRTQQSAFAFMYGFFEKATLNDTIRIKTVPNVNFCPLDMCACPALDHLIKDKEAQHAKLMRGNPKFMNVMRSVAQTLYGTTQITTLPGINQVAEILTTLVCHNMPYPYGSSGTITPIQHAVYHKLLEETWVSQSHVKDGTYEKVGRMFIQPLLTDMLRTMYKITQGVSKPRFVFNSGHDITIRPIVDGLKLSSPGWPHYASRVVFELWGRATSKEHFLRVLAYGKDQTDQVQFCKGKMTADGLCPFSALVSFVEKENMEYFYSESYRDACTRTY
ncbi:2-phosphoxylose phosphatase 1 [Strongylocentrotus purpuratus]|uniref:2-phosphoxylose phosphatase 1 n=1 Tax=Strongylocentrotus purpuratus TaxID=7668 RepID=A0A7M7NII5_STRPU|nr:2-phosphoxylose phosphatase 1 [Strongylocentrotus purpuratus]